jgi:hypothetical protein
MRSFWILPPRALRVMLALLVFQWSCSGTPPLSSQAPAADKGPNGRDTITSASGSEVKTTSRPIGLAVGDASPQFDILEKPETAVDNGVAAGAKEGAGKGVSACFQGMGGGGLGGGPYAGLALAAWLVLCPPVGAVVGATIGGVSAYKHRVSVTNPSYVSADFRKAVKRSAATAQDDLLKALQASASANGISTITLSSKSWAPSDTAPTKQAAPAETPVASVLDVRIVRFIAVASGVASLADGLAVEARVRVIALPSGKVVDTYSFIRLTKNAASNAVQSGPIDLDLPSVYQAIAEAALEESILVYRGNKEALPTSPGDKVAVENESPGSAFPDYTLRPITPPAENYPPSGSAQSIATERAKRRLADLQPVFQWEALPASFYRDIARANGIQDLTYEFRLYQGLSEAPYSRSGLAAPTHSVEMPLSPCELYSWTVRAHFTLEGRPRVTEWTGMYNGSGVLYSSGRVTPGPSAIDPAWYRRNSLPRLLDRLPSGGYYPQFRTPAASPSQDCPQDQFAPSDTLQTGGTNPPSGDLRPQRLGLSGAQTAWGINAPEQPTSLSGTQVGLLNPSSTAEKLALPTVGDTWRYNVFNGGQIVDTLTVAVVGLSATQITESVTRGNSTNFKAERVFGRNFDPTNGVQESELPGMFFLAEFSPYAAPTRADIGREWNGIDASLTVTLQGKKRQDWHLKVKVVGVERIRVPAGEFEALKVEVVSDTHRLNMDCDGSVRLLFWYVPYIKRTVKMVRHVDMSMRVLSYTDVYELTSYKVN